MIDERSSLKKACMGVSMKFHEREAFASCMVSVAFSGVGDDEDKCQTPQWRMSEGHGERSDAASRPLKDKKGCFP